MATMPHVFTGPADTQVTIQNVRDQIIGVDVQVPLLDGTQRMYVNFDNAASTPALRPRDRQSRRVPELVLQCPPGLRV